MHHQYESKEHKKGICGLVRFEYSDPEKLDLVKNKIFRDNKFLLTIFKL